MAKPNFEALWNAALAAGNAAAAAIVPTPMVVSNGNNGKTYFVGDGVCGFGWLTFKGNTAFGKWAKANGIARPGYPKGLSVWSPLRTQSLARNEAWAYAAADALRAAGINDAYGHSRID